MVQRRWLVAGDGGTAELRREMLTTASLGCLIRAWYELHEVTMVLPKQREEDEKDPRYLDHDDLGLRRGHAHGGGDGSGQCALTKTQ